MSDKLDYKDIFELLSADGRQPVAAVYMTYGFDAQLFESHVLPGFLGVSAGADDYDMQSFSKNGMYIRNQVANRLREIPVAVYSDGGQYVGGCSFLYDHIAVQGRTFHPKCYLLLFKEFLRIVITSANLTIPGLCYNAEILWQADLYPDKPSSIAGDLLDILTEIDSISGSPTPEALKEINRYLSKIQNTNEYPQLISTCQIDSPFTQMIQAVEKNGNPPKEISIVSPFYETDREIEFDKSMALSFLDRFEKNIKINLYFPAAYLNGKWLVTAPAHLFAELSAKYPNTAFYAITSQWESETDQLVNRALHGKLICVRYADNSYLYLGGSINFTERAMRSHRGKLLNIEIGVMEMTKQAFNLPKCVRVHLNELEVREQAAPVPKPVCFVLSVVLDGSVLTIQTDTAKTTYPYTILYDSTLLTTIEKAMDPIIFTNFKLKRCQDLEISVDGVSFFIPILVLHKSELVTEDLEWDFKMEFSDMIDFLAGRYRSIAELRQKVKATPSLGVGSSLTGLYFRQNLQRYFKAMDALKQGLEQPFYSEYSFGSYLSGPVGLQKLVDMILEDYVSGAAEKPESFLFITELLQVLLHLDFKADWVGVDFKQTQLDTITDQLYPPLQGLLHAAKGQLLLQYKIICEAYGIEVG